MNLRKLFVMFALAPLFATPQAVGGKLAEFDGIGAQSSTPEWERYNVGKEFSVRLPVPPAMSTISISFEMNKTRRERTVGAYADGVVYLIHTVEKKGMSLDQLIRRTASGETTGSTTVDGLTGRSSSGDTESTTWHMKWLETSGSLYLFQATASKLGDHSAAIDRFFSSISFKKNQDGRIVFDGPGEQPLTHANDAEADSIFRSKEITVRARVISKPEPHYTERARQNQTTGTVVLRGIFSSSGAVENITVLRGLSDGLTERAIEAARKIRFIPPIKDGRFISMWIQLEYNFNLY